MEYVYGVMLLHAAGKEITEDALGKVLEAAGVKVDKTRVKALTASLEGVNIAEAIATAAVAAAPAAAAPASESGGKDKKGKKEEKEEKEEEGPSEEEAAAGLGALFG
jgi:large subunit ribosomal protein L12